MDIFKTFLMVVGVTASLITSALADDFDLGGKCSEFLAAMNYTDTHMDSVSTSEFQLQSEVALTTMSWVSGFLKASFISDPKVLAREKMSSITVELRRLCNESPSALIFNRMIDLTMTLSDNAATDKFLLEWKATEKAQIP